MTLNLKHCLISIFMPVYNGSKYLENSIESVLKQSFKDFELVCVDDSSTDNSYEILLKIASTDSRIRVFRKINGGTVPKSWNFIMPYLMGESITYMSQDDLMSEDNLEQMFKKHQETGADCILPDMVLYYEGSKENKSIVGVDGNRDIILTNKEAVILSLNWKIHGFALWSSKIIKNEFFPEDSFDCDEYITRKLFLKSNKVAFCNGIFYYRQDNQNALTKNFSIKNYYSILKDFYIYKLLDDNYFDATVINLVLFGIFRLHFTFFRYCLLRKAIYSDFEYNHVRFMLDNLYSQLNKKKIIEFARFVEGSKRYKVYLFRILYFNYSLFKMLMFLVCLLDRSYERIKSIKNRIILLIEPSNTLNV
jgi:glycosyltransferase involved in cell wall biosynthesis